MGNINYDDYTDIVNFESVKEIMEAMGYEMRSGHDFVVLSHIIQEYGKRDYQIKNKDIINSINDFKAGYDIGRGKRPYKSFENLTENGVEWTYDSQANMDIIDDIIEHTCFNNLMTESDREDKKYLIAFDKTRSYCLDLMSKRKYTARTMTAIADAYFDGYYGCLEEKK